MEDIFSVKGRVALVTGAASGIGASFARTLARHGAAVACCARREASIAAVASDIAARGGAALAVPMDVTDRAAVAAAFAAAEARFGTVDIVVNVAGITAPRRPIHEQDDEAWDSLVATNLTGVYNVCKEGARRLIAAGKGGNVVVVTSGAAFRGGMGLSAYNASKAGAANLVRSMALDLVHHGIVVNAIAPGLVNSEMHNAAVAASPKGRAMLANTPMGRPAEPSELDGALLLLASAGGSSFLTGVHLPVDGGMEAGQPGQFVGVGFD